MNEAAPIFFLEKTMGNAMLICKELINVDQLCSQGVLRGHFIHVGSIGEAYGLRESGGNEWLASRIEEKSKPTHAHADSKHEKARL